MSWMPSSVIFDTFYKRISPHFLDLLISLLILPFLLSFSHLIPSPPTSVFNLYISHLSVFPAFWDARCRDCASSVLNKSAAPVLRIMSFPLLLSSQLVACRMWLLPRPLRCLSYSPLRVVHPPFNYLIISKIGFAELVSSPALSCHIFSTTKSCVVECLLDFSRPGSVSLLEKKGHGSEPCDCLAPLEIFSALYY
jgi:hypothetical protein